MRRVACSEGMERYFQDLAARTERCYNIARKARSRGKDPEVRIEIPQAEDLASRVEKLLADWNVEGVAERIRELSLEHGNREVVSLLIAKEIATRPAKTREEAIDRAVRVGLAVLTEGILVAPLEGIASVKIGRNSDGSEYLALVFAGPIRAAGGTGQAMSVLIGDVVRRELNIGEYRPTQSEISRFHEEIPLYKSCQHLQYSPSPAEIELIVGNCPVCIDGEGTEEAEISGYRDLPRIETNRVRGGACLVIAEGLCQKAAKIQKHVNALQIGGWDFIDGLLAPSGSSDGDDQASKVRPATKYLKDIVAGRPIFGHPSRPGGFRLRYGRGRTCGLAAIAISPASMYALDEFPAIGTQIKIERPGKAGAVTPCDSIEGPIVLLKNGDLIQCDTVAEVREVKDRIAELVDIGEMLIPFGEFSENNHPLVPVGYCLEWHREELRHAYGELPEGWERPDFEEALRMSREKGVPLHPRHNLFWSDMTVEELVALRQHILANATWEGESLTIPDESSVKRALEGLGALHRMVDGRIRLDRYASPLIHGLGLARKEGGLTAVTELEGEDSSEAVSKAMGVKVLPRAVTRIGSRMARPEKAKERRMNPPVHSLFPIGMEGGSQRLMSAALTKMKEHRPGNGETKGIKVDLGIRRCQGCERTTYMITCPQCGSRTSVENEARAFDRRAKVNVELDQDYARALQALGISNAPEVKGVQGMTSKEKVPEPLEKGILRAKHEVFVFKDGTTRYDMTDLPITHFRPREIGLSVERAHELGYTEDMHGNPLTDPEQLCELRVQDFIPSTGCGDYMVRVARFLDELLTSFYGLEPFYDVASREDLIGHLGIGLAPHTSGGVLTRIIGFMPASGGYAHPFFHAAKRRNCDGDEDCIMLLLDGLMNFSRLFLPDRRGGLMDAPLVLTTRLDPDEVDKEAHNLDCLSEYPLEFYHAARDYLHPKQIEDRMDMVGSRIGSSLQFERIGFTHDTNDIAEGPYHSKYTTLETMMDKMSGQLELGRKIRAVDEKDVVTRVIDKHFLPDMVGNLRSFSAQKLRCTKCGESYRRIPLSGKCRCGNGLTLTVHEASVKKYLQVSKEMGERYGLSEYTRQRIEVLEMSMASLFDNDKVRKCKLSDFM